MGKKVKSHKLASCIFLCYTKNIVYTNYMLYSYIVTMYTNSFLGVYPVVPRGYFLVSVQ